MNNQMLIFKAAILENGVVRRHSAVRIRTSVSKTCSMNSLTPKTWSLTPNLQFYDECVNE